MKQFIVDRHTVPGTPSMDEVPNEKIPIYNSLADAEADLANLEKGQIGSTKDTGAELSQPVDVVESGNMHAVTSNAVAEAIKPVDITSQVTENNTYLSELKVIKSGNVVDVYFITQAVTEANAIGATGLPLPKSGILAYGVQIFGTGSMAYTRAEVSGYLTVQCNSASTAVGHICYICE
jgi:hypothetical protein